MIERGRVRCRNALNEIKGILSSEKYKGFCPLCGRDTVFTKKGRNLRETFSCRYCGSFSRNRHVAKVLQERFAILPPYSLGKLLDAKPDLKVYEAASYGPIHNTLKNLKGYVCSEFFYDVPPGQCNKQGIRCENLEYLTFPDDSFDVVITQDVFEHVRNFESGFKEVHRVLKKGGFHIFTVPVNPRKKTVKRIEMRNGEAVYLLPKVYHLDPTRGGLVYTDFGYDLPVILEEFGFSTKIHWCSGIDGKYYGIYWISAIVAEKI